MTRQRPDAAQRRRQLLDAADEVFCQHGVLAPLELVIERAGLGRATLYRNFADRAALMEALLDRSLLALQARARDLAAHPTGFFELLRDAAEHMAVSAALVDYWRTMARTHRVVTQAQARTLAIFAPLLEVAIASGRCRADLAQDDVALMLNMLAGCLRGETEAERRALALRACELLGDALVPAVMRQAT
ncbi:MAG: helix-turn-helix domain-containing protein [Pseudoxanthomonas sp.]